MRIVVAVILVAAEVVATVYLAFVAYLLTGWMVDDSFAAEATSADWYRTGLVRLAIAVCVASVFGTAMYFANGIVTRQRWPRLRAVFAASLAAAVAVAAAAGTVEFVTTRPYM